ncbi:MAG: FtsX-like permease family protein [Paludibacteraceae bacterium]|nr:FtsX-like permease family protein [Paludibacteraceae bacterium]
MNLALYIAKRYLFSKKRHNAINIVSLISMCGVVVGSIALVCVLSVFNGFQTVVEDLFSNFDAQIKIVATSGKVFQPDSITHALTHPDIQHTCHVIEDNALLKFGEKQLPITIKGVPQDYTKVSGIDSILVEGEFSTKEGSFNMAVGGIVLANTLGSGLRFVQPIWLYAPKRIGNVNPMMVDKAFNREHAFLTGIYMVQQEKYDNNFLIVPLELTRRLYDYTTEVTAVELKLTENADEREVKSYIADKLGSQYKVLDRYEQQEEFFNMLQIEKWVTYLILSFILLIAIFNIVGSLSMLIIEKKDDVKILSSLGAEDSLIKNIFLFEGWLISVIGAFIGIIIGVVLCYIQMEFGIIKLASTAGTYLVDAYPVKLVFSDIILIFLTVLSMGFGASYIATRRINS